MQPFKCGKDNPNYKTLEHYRYNPIRRWNFQEKCKARGLKFESYEEIESWKINKKGKPKMYYYVPIEKYVSNKGKKYKMYHDAK